MIEDSRTGSRLPSLSDTFAQSRFMIVAALGVVASCSDDGGGPVDSGVGDAGRDGARDAPSDAARDSTADRMRVDMGPPVACSITVTANTYELAPTGCAGIVSCRGVIAYMNNSPVTLNYPTIRFTIPDGASCISTHANSRWVISDNGATSRQCYFTTNPDAMPWNVAPGGMFRFGYDLPVGFPGTPPTDVTVSDPACPASEGGAADAGGATTDAAPADAPPTDVPQTDASSSDSVSDAPGAETRG